MAWQRLEVKDEVEVKSLYTLFKRQHQCGYSFIGEMHDFWEMMYVIDGEVTVSADENIHEFRSGDIIFHKPLELHKFNVDGKNGATLLVISFDMTGKLADSMKNAAYHLNGFQRSVINNFLEFLDVEYEKTADLRGEKNSPNILTYFENDSIFLQTTALFITRMVLMLSGGAKTLLKTKTYETELFKKALQIMNENISENISVSDIAENLNMSVSGLKRLFNKYAGMSVHKYFLTLKIKTATIMLKNGTPVGEVADSLGFSSQAYFSATYKRETGNNPSQT